MLAKDNVQRVGYKLFDCGDHWELHFNGGKFSGNLKQVCTYAVHQLEFSMAELEMGVLEMNKHFHDGAEYGIFKRFMWTFDKEIIKHKVS